MEWKKRKVTSILWESGDWRIEEIGYEAYRAMKQPYGLYSPDAEPEFFSTLEEAKGTAALRNEVAVVRADNERLRKELEELRQDGALDFGDALEAGIPPVSCEADDGRWDEVDMDAAIDRVMAGQTDGRGIPAAH